MLCANYLECNVMTKYVQCCAVISGGLELTQDERIFNLLMMKFRQFNSGDSRAYSGLERGPGRLRRVRYLTRVTRGRHSPLG